MSGRPGKECDRLLRELARKSKARGDNATSQKFNRLASRFQKLTAEDGGGAAATAAGAPLEPKAYFTAQELMGITSPFICVGSDFNNYHFSVEPKTSVAVLSIRPRRYLESADDMTHMMDVPKKDALRRRMDDMYKQMRFAPTARWELGTGSGQWCSKTPASNLKWSHVSAPVPALKGVFPAKDAFVLDHGDCLYTVFAYGANVVRTPSPVVRVVTDQDNPILVTDTHAITNIGHRRYFVAVPLSSLKQKDGGTTFVNIGAASNDANAMRLSTASAFTKLSHNDDEVVMMRDYTLKVQVTLEDEKEVIEYADLDATTKKRVREWYRNQADMMMPVLLISDAGVKVTDWGKDIRVQFRGRMTELTKSELDSVANPDENYNSPIRIGDAEKFVRGKVIGTLIADPEPVSLAIPNNIVKRADLAHSQMFILSTVQQTFRLNFVPRLGVMVLSSVSGRYVRANEDRVANVYVIDKDMSAPGAIVHKKYRFAPLVAWKIGSQDARGYWFGTADRTKPFLALIPGENAFVVDHGSYTYTVFAKEAFVVTTQDPVLCVVGGADDPVLLTRNHAIAQLVEGGSFTAVPLGALYSKRVGNITALELVNIVTSNLSTGFDVHSLKTRPAFQQVGTDDIDDGYYAW